jgi:hypothetical protein
VDVAPTMEWLAEDLLVGALKAQLHSESLLAEPIVYTLDEGTLSRYELRVSDQLMRVTARCPRLGVNSRRGGYCWSAWISGT